MSCKNNLLGLCTYVDQLKKVIAIQFLSIVLPVSCRSKAAQAILEGR